MKVSLGFRATPEEEELEVKKRELQDLEDRLISSELHLADLKGDMAGFERLYLKIVGVRYAALDEIEAQIAELLAQREPGNIAVRGAAREARARAEDSRTGTTGAAIKETKRFSPSSSLKSLYREVARRIHPDLAVNEADRAKRQKLMAQANEAYERGDQTRLQEILKEYESSPEAVNGEGTGADLVRVIRKIAQVRRRLAEIDAELERIRESDLSELKKTVDDGAKQGRDVLNEIICSVTLQIEQRQKELHHLGKPVKQ